MSLSEKGNVSRAAGVVGFFTLLSRILGLARDVVLAGCFGTGMVADAFFVAFRIPNLLRRLFAEGSLTIAFIPIFTEYLTVKSKEEAFELARVVLTLLSLILVVITVCGVFLAPWIVRIQAPGFGSAGDKYQLAVLLTRITFPYILLISVTAFFMGVLNSLRHFAAPAASPILLNVGIIGGALLLSPLLSEPIVGVAVGVLIGGFLQVALQIPWILKQGLKFRPLWRPGHPALHRIGVLMLPAVFGSAVYQFNQFMGTLFASFLPEGSVSWLYYADRLVQFPLGVFAIAISTAVLPSLSTQAAQHDLDDFGSTLTHALGMTLFVSLPSMVGLLVLGTPLIRLFFERGAFDAHSVVMTNQALFFYTLGLWAFSGTRVIVSAFYALQDTVTPVKVAVAALAANLAFSLLFMGPLRHGGLALALSSASSIQFCLLVFLLKRKLPSFDIMPVAVSALKSATAAAAMGWGVYYASHLWMPPGVKGGSLATALDLTALVTLGVGLYVGAAKVLGCNEISALQETILPKVARRLKSGD